MLRNATQRLLQHAAAAAQGQQQLQLQQQWGPAPASVVVRWFSEPTNSAKEAVERTLVVNTLDMVGGREMGAEHQTAPPTSVAGKQHAWGPLNLLEGHPGRARVTRERREGGQGCGDCSISEEPSAAPPDPTQHSTPAPHCHLPRRRPHAPTPLGRLRRPPRQAKKFESAGLSRQQAEALTEHITTQVILDRCRLSEKFVAKADLEKVGRSCMCKGVTGVGFLRGEQTYDQSGVGSSREEYSLELWAQSCGGGVGGGSQLQPRKQ
jgi:hypothetical protein